MIEKLNIWTWQRCFQLETNIEIKNKNFSIIISFSLSSTYMKILRTFNNYTWN